MPQGMSQWARAVVVGASHRVRRDMGLLRALRGQGPVNGGYGRVSEPQPSLSNGDWTNQLREPGSPADRGGVWATRPSSQPVIAASYAGSTASMDSSPP